MASRLVACSSCGCHARRVETNCPHCGEKLRKPDGSMGVTATALVLGLAAVSLTGMTGGCDDEVRDVDDDGASTSSSTDSTASAAAYGVPQTVGQGGTTGVGGDAQAYGVPETTGVGANGGAGGSGGGGGSGGSGGSGGVGGN